MYFAVSDPVDGCIDRTAGDNQLTEIFNEFHIRHKEYGLVDFKIPDSPYFLNAGLGIILFNQTVQNELMAAKHRVSCGACAGGCKRLNACWSFLHKGQITKTEYTIFFPN